MEVTQEFPAVDLVLLVLHHPVVLQETCLVGWLVSY
jgi:hypothetical protein